MGYYCTVPQCTSLAGKTKNVKFHRFPRDDTMAVKWNEILKRGKPYTKYSKVCSLHFTQADYNVTTMGQWKTLSKDAVPSQNLPKLHPDGTVMVIRKSRSVKYRDGKKDDISAEKQDKWAHAAHTHAHAAPADTHVSCEPHDTQLYRYALGALSPPPRQDATMQTDPVPDDDDDGQPNNSYSEVADKFGSHLSQYALHDYQKDAEYEKKYEAKDYTNKHEDFLRTNEEYNNEADKYALERKSLVDFSKPVDNYQKLSDLYPRNDYMSYPYHDSVEHLRNQQQNLQILQDRTAENQNFFNENHIKQEIDMNGDEEKFLYDRHKDQLESRGAEQSLQHCVKQEPDVAGCESALPQTSPYYAAAAGGAAGGYYGGASRPGPELLIAKQNALAAHTQLWQNTMKRPFFYSDSAHYNGPPLLARYEDITRILQ